MKKVNAELLFKSNNQLGEGPLWHPGQKRLYWVDIIAGNLYQSTPDLDGFTHAHFNITIGAFGFQADGGMILASGEGFSSWQPGGSKPDILWNPLPKREGVRLNDGKVDPAGRFWAGSMDTTLNKGELYRLDPDGSRHTLLHNIGISNGLGWPLDRKTMYTTDSNCYTIYAFDFDLNSGAISNQRPFVQLPKTKGEIVPDGLCVDVEGCVWSAHWNGWEVVRYSPDGDPILRVEIPAQRVTSCCFGGEKYDQLFITTARSGLSNGALQEQPLAGDVFILSTNTQGQEANFFGGPQK